MIESVGSDYGRTALTVLFPCVLCLLICLPICLPIGRLTSSPADDFGCGAGCSWSWNHSNFYPGDLLDSDYDINTVSHQPVYGQNIFKDIESPLVQVSVFCIYSKDALLLLLSG